MSINISWTDYSCFDIDIDSIIEKYNLNSSSTHSDIKDAIIDYSNGCDDCSIEYSSFYIYADSLIEIIYNYMQGIKTPNHFDLGEIKYDDRGNVIKPQLKYEFEEN